MLRCLAIALAAGLALPVSAGAGTTVGEAFVPTTGMNNTTTIQSGSPGGQYVIPFDGVITSWSHLGGTSSGQIRLKVARAAGANSFTIVGDSALESITGEFLHIYPTRIPVRGGDILGAYGAGALWFITNASTSYATSNFFGDPAQGSTDTYGGPFAGHQIDVSAILEPDADADGFGDETQDQCPSEASTQGPCATPPDTSAPDTAITMRPKDRTKRKTATFGFESSEPGSSFECRLDGNLGFSPCSSPQAVKVAKGKHSFEVRAKDPAGNADPTPATDSWKVRKKK